MAYEHLGCFDLCVSLFPNSCLNSSSPHLLALSSLQSFSGHPSWAGIFWIPLAHCPRELWAPLLSGRTPPSGSTEGSQLRVLIPLVPSCLAFNILKMDSLNISYLLFWSHILSLPWLFQLIPTKLCCSNPMLPSHGHALAGASFPTVFGSTNCCVSS